MPTRSTAENRAPVVSIGFPVYNGETYLAEALDSLLAQTYADFELIISDNGSTDRTPEICSAYAARDRRIRCYRQQENRGAAWNFNHVFELARGTYFKWAAHDDVHRPTYLERCVRVLDESPDVIWCHSKTMLIDAGGQPLAGPEGGIVSYVAANSAGGGIPSEPGHPNGSKPPPTRESRCARNRFRGVLLGSRGNRDIFGLARAAVLRQTSLHMPYYGADKVLIAELSLRGRYREVPEPLYLGRVHPDGSGALRTAAEQQHFIDPRGHTRPFVLRLRLLAGYCRAILGADLTPVDRLRCFGVVAQYLFQIRKWWKVVVRTITGTGTGGGYLPALRALEERDRTGSAAERTGSPAERTASAAERTGSPAERTASAAERTDHGIGDEDGSKR